MGRERSGGPGVAERRQRRVVPPPVAPRAREGSAPRLRLARAPGDRLITRRKVLRQALTSPVVQHPACRLPPGSRRSGGGAGCPLHSRSTPQPAAVTAAKFERAGTGQVQRAVPSTSLQPVVTERCLLPVEGSRRQGRKPANLASGPPAAHRTCEVHRYRCRAAKMAPSSRLVQGRAPRQPSPGDS